MSFGSPTNGEDIQLDLFKTQVSLAWEGVPGGHVSVDLAVFCHFTMYRCCSCGYGTRLFVPKTVVSVQYMTRKGSQLVRHFL